MEKWRLLILSRSYLKFPCVKNMVRKTAHKILWNTNIIYFLSTGRQNVVCQNVCRDFGGIMYIRILFKLVRVLNRTNFWAIWIRTSEDIGHFKTHARPATFPPRQVLRFLEAFQFLIEVWVYHETGSASISKNNARGQIEEGFMF